MGGIPAQPAYPILIDHVQNRDFLNFPAYCVRLMLLAFITGLAIGAFLSISMGPVVFALIKQSVNNGLKSGILFALGVSFSDTSFVLLGNLASQYILMLESFKRQIGIGGGILLLMMGIHAIFFRKPSLGSGDEEMPPLGKKDYLKSWLAGLLMNTLNPAVVLFWIPTIAGLTVKFPDPDERVVLYVTCLGFVLTTDLIKATLADKIRHKLTLRKVILLNRISGTIICCFGLFLIYKVIFEVGNMAVH
ncbi:MAG: LysE family transporter [Thermoflavifilum aggregans]|nr:LysE family transporter [Thermoflavifilum aggregans]